MLMTVISDLLHDNFEQLISSAVRAARCILALHGNAASKATKQVCDGFKCSDDNLFQQ